MALSLQRYVSIYNYRYKEEVTMTSILEKRAQRERKRSSGVLMKKIGDSLPEHILMEILSWLPVKTLLRFKVVCKSWNDIVKNPGFISMHLRNYYSNNDDCSGCLIAQYEVTQAGELNVFEFLADDKTHRYIASEEIMTPEYNTHICGPCDGIYYLSRSYNDGRFLWNPTLNEIKHLPPLIMKPDLPSHITFNGLGEFYGFGYDPLTKDYKVIVIMGYRDSTKDCFYEDRFMYPISIFIYSLRNDSWRYWGDLPKYYYLQNNSCYVFVNESIYWLGSHDPCGLYDYDGIIAFNLATDNFQELQLPHHEKSFDEHLIVCQDSVALVVGYREKNCFMMWSLNDQGIWTKKCCMNFDSEVYYRPVGHWTDNKIVLQRGKMLVLCDLDTQEIWYLKSPLIIDYYKCTTISAYKESLVSVIDRKMWVQRDGRLSRS